MDQYAIYLRKSRADVEAEMRGEGETLARHRRALTELAVRRGYNVTAIYEEIVSGDTIASRPQMQALLAAVESGLYRGIIVNDADRLARGDSIDQGIVKQAFYATGTLIITPYKTYDPANESDEDFFDFSLFMARFEYRKIKQRMQTGRARSAAEGNWIGTRIPLGYTRVNRTDRKGYTLAPDPDTAPFIAMMFRMYDPACGDENGNVLTSNEISERLYRMGFRSQFGNTLTANDVRRLLQSRVYIGETSWAKRVKKAKVVNGAKTYERVKNEEPIICENAHTPLIDRATFDRVQNRFATHRPLPKNKESPVKNVLSGLIICSECGHALQRTPGTQGRPDGIKCRTMHCPTCGTYIPIVEKAILDVLKEWEVMFSSPDQAIEDPRENQADTARNALVRQIESLNKQLDKMYDLVEQGIYTPQVFLQRSGEVKSRIAEATAQLDAIKTAPSKADIIRRQLPQIRFVLEAYPLSDDPKYKNDLLKTVISRVIYSKTKVCTRADNPADYMTLDIYPLIPE